MKLHRPDPILKHDALPVDATTKPRQAAIKLRDGKTLIVTDAYGTGADILEALRTVIRAPSSEASYAARQAYRRTVREASLRLLAPVVKHRMKLKHAAPIGFLEELYPKLVAFALPFVQVQELHGAWQTYLDGVKLAVLGHKVFPFYGTYAPTRTSHLELFATWMSQYEGPRTRAVDVGTGCGVLALMLCKAGFEQVLATDDNPNAIESVSRELRRHKIETPVELQHVDLLGHDPQPAEVIVFNPPWMKGEVRGHLDRALYFEDGLFERFFEQADARLTPSGRIVLLFSNVITLVQPDVPHPIEAELERGRFKLVKKLKRKVKPPRGKDGKRRNTREKVEVWELERV